MGSIGGVTLRWAAATDVGRVRSVNEDSLVARPPSFVVADGMGGHRAGDVASAMVVERFGRFDPERLPAMGEVVDAITEVNDAILEQGRRSAERSGMGTTAVGLVVVDNRDQVALLVFNIGDSRAYRLGPEGFEQLSVDHSFVQELVDAGQLSRSDARLHPERNVVTRALGVVEGARADFWLRVPGVGERYLLCSDGLTTEIDDGAIESVLGSAESMDAVATRLVAEAVDAGGHDNVTVVVVEVVAVDGVGAELDDTSPKRGVATLVERGPSTPSVADPEIVDVASVPRRGRPRVQPAADEDPELIADVPVLADDSAAEHPGPTFELVEQERSVEEAPPGEDAVPSEPSPGDGAAEAGDDASALLSNEDDGSVLEKGGEDG